MELVWITARYCLYWLPPVSCAKEHDDSAADATRKEDLAVTAGRQNRRSKCTKRP